MLMFEMTLRTAEEFFLRCKERGADTEEQRLAILKELAEEGQLKSVMQTNRTADQVAKDMAKNFGNVLYVKPKEKRNGKSRRTSR
jgi:hypothetical protein